MGERLNYCVLQLPPSPIALIEADARRPDACATLAHLFAGGGGHAGPVLTEFAPGQNPVVIVTPEYAFGHGDWLELDALVRAQQRPVVLIAGFGATPASTIEAWAGENGDTARRLSWNPDVAQLAAVRPVNAAWCWIHGFGLDTTCVVLLKRHMEQGSELVALDWIQSGTHLLRLAFQDLDLLPMICADLVQTFADGEDAAVHRVRAALQADAGQKPILITGSLLQTAPSNPNWTVAIDGWLNQATLGREALVALANVAIDKPVRSEGADCWRSLTGVFSRMTAAPKGQSNLRVTRGVAPPSFRGAVVRVTAPYAAAGPLAWPPYGPTGERFFWHAAMGASLAGAGVAAPVGRPPEVEVTELARFTRRIPAADDWCPGVQTGLATIRAHVELGVVPNAAEVLTGLLRGVSRERGCGPDEVAEEPNGAALTQGLHSLATLVAETGHFDWRTTGGQAGQLVLSGANANILVWRDPALSGRQIRHALGAWAEEPLPHPHLVVIAAGPHGQLEEGHIAGHPRDNIEAGPDSGAPLNVGGGLADDPSDITDRKFLRDITCVRLERVTALYVDYDAGQDAERMATFVDHLRQAAQAA